MVSQVPSSGPTTHPNGRGFGAAGADQAGDALIASHRRSGGIELQGLKRDLDALALRDPEFSRAVYEAVERQLTPVQRGELARARYRVDGPGGSTFTIGAGAPSVSDYRAMASGSAGRLEYERLDRVFGDGDPDTDDAPVIERGLQRIIAGEATPDTVDVAGGSSPAARPIDSAKLTLDLTQMGLDLAGIADPSGVADGSNALISGARAIGSAVSGNWSEAGGHLVNGGISVLGIAAGVGDLAKLGKFGKWADTIGDAMRAIADNPELRGVLEPGLRKVHELVSRIPQGALDAAPASARESIQRMKAQLDEFFAAGGRTSEPAGYTATVRGQEVTLRGVDATPIHYVKRDRAEYATLRREFDGGVRADFARSLASEPGKVDALRRAGLDDAAIERLASGRLPQGWQVHHKLPLDDGGTNAFENLLLIRNDPHHIAITNEQRRLVGDLVVGEGRQVNFPIPRGSVYPPAP